MLFLSVISVFACFYSFPVCYYSFVVRYYSFVVCYYSFVCAITSSLSVIAVFCVHFLFYYDLFVCFSIV